MPAPQPSAAGGAVAAANWASAQPIDVVMTEFAFAPAHIRLRAGQPYRLHLENHGSGGHSISAPKFFASATWRDEATAAVAAGSDAIEVAPGAARDLYLTPRQTGTFPFECSHFLHSTFGMVGDIVVE
jgi:uncharacterized cupredoxin-like copper-binding protein